MSRKSKRNGINGNGHKRHYFIQPLDSYTNEVIAGRLEASEFCDKLRCGDDIVQGWRCNFDFAKFLWRSSEELKLKYHLFSQDGDGPIRRRKSNRLLAKRSAAKIIGSLKQRA